MARKRKAAEVAPAAEEEAPPVEEQEEEDEGDDDEDEDVEFEEGEEEDEEDEGEEGEPSAAQEWFKALKRRADDSNTFLMVLGNMDKEDDDDDDDEEEKEQTTEELEAMTRVFLPKKTEQYLEQLSASLGDIGCTDPDDDDEEEEALEGLTPEQKAALKRAMHGMFRMLSTRHSYPMQELIETSLKGVDKAIKAKDWEDAFCRWVGTLLSAMEEGNWYGDTDVPEVAEKIYKKLKSQWAKIRSHSIQELGNPTCEGGSDPDIKKAMDKMLQRLTDSLRQIPYDI